MKLNSLFVVLFLSFCFYNTTEAAGSMQQEAEDAEYRELLENQARSMDVDIAFYGTIKDQHEQPVSDVKVVFKLHYFSLIDHYFQGVREVVAVTDNEGNFLLQGIKGSCLSLHDIEKDGFEYIRDTNPTFDYGGLYGGEKFIPDPHNPIVFILHKKPDPAFVVEKVKSYLGRSSGEILQVDVYDGFFRSSRTRKGIWGDVRIEIQPAAKEGDHIVKITLNNHDDWLLAKDPGKNHVAPDDGYVKSVEFEIKQHEELVKDFYYKGQKETGTAYARLLLNLSAGNTSVRVGGKLYINLDGGKNLNYDRKYTLNRKIQDISAKIEADPKNVLLYKECAELKRSLRLYDEALADIDQAIVLAPEDKSLLRLKERIQTNKERHAELEAEGFEF